MRQLFSKIFKKEMTQALWEWKYLRIKSVSFGVWRGNELVAHYGATNTHVWFNGKETRAVQICDVMVDPSVRKAARKQSPFFLATSAFIERYVGFEKTWPMGFGFPSDRHMNLAAHLQLYAPVGRIWELSWTLASRPRVPILLKTTRLDLENLARHRDALDLLGAQQRAGLSERIVIHKDAKSLEWRYLRHPQETYELVLVTHRLTNKPVGLCVLKLESERVLWMDVLGPPAHLPALAQVVRAATWRSERRTLALWCSEPDIGRFGSVTNARALPITIPANIWTPGPAPEDLLNRWWLLAGDTDYL